MEHSNIPMRQNDAKAIRSIRKILRGNPPEVFDHTAMLQEDPAIVHNAMMLGLCMLMAGVILVLGCAFAHADCRGLSPELQKAYEQLRKDGFNVSCRKGL